MARLTECPAWAALNRHKEDVAQIHLRALFAEDPGRAARFSVAWGAFYADFSKQRITDDTLGLLTQLADERGVPAARGQMLCGAAINKTEGRAALHTALRAPADAEVSVEGRNVIPDVQAVLTRMEHFVDAVRSGAWTGHTGAPIRDVVAIGIGGSHLGPDMAVTALAPYGRDGPDIHFVSNVDGAQIAGILERIDPESALFVISSKSWTTDETMTNAATARAWFLASGAPEEAIARHFAAVSTNGEGVRAFGIDPENMFAFWDWVGGRFSLWSAIGLPIALKIGMENFRALLAGAHAADRHFADAPLNRNIPVLMALIGVWNINFLGAGSQAILPYEAGLKLLPAYLQQAEMESNGKRVTLNGADVEASTAPVIWGAPGTDGQHSFHQLLHQGTETIPADFILPLKSHAGLPVHQDKLIANCLAQGEALMCGRTDGETRALLKKNGGDLARAPHMTFPGNRPSTTLLIDRLTPETLGSLIAVYEHKIFVQGVIWGINSFDQWGVELGKTLAKTILADLKGEGSAGHDSSTATLIARAKAARQI